MGKRRKDPRSLLRNVLTLISKDIKEIEKLSASGKLEPDVSACLTRYSDALLKIIKDADTQENEERQKFANMSTEELTEIAKRYVK